MFRLLRYLKPHWKLAVLAPLLLLVEVASDLLQPMLMASIINDGVMKQDLAHVQSTGLLMIGVALVGLLGGLGCIIFASIASQNFGADLRRNIYKKVQTFSFHNLDQFKTGSLVTRLTNDVMQMQMFVQMLMRILTRAPVTALGSLILAFVISPSLAVILIIVIPVLITVLITILRKAMPLFSAVQKKLDGVNTVLLENLTGMRVVKAFVRAIYEKSRFGKANDDYRDQAIRAARMMAYLHPVMMMLLNGSIVIALWYGGNQYWNQTLPLGDLVAFINYVTHVMFSLMMTSMMLMFITRAKVSADRINEVFDTEPDIISPKTPKGKTIQGHVAFENVSFAYNASDQNAEPEWVLKEISFSAKPGETIAILGATGSGKSTLVHLISRLYDVTSGQVLIDGVNVKEMDLHELRSQIGYVLQKPILFSGTIKENIRFGRPDASDEEVEAAARAAQAHEFIAKLPDGYDTPLGQRGVNLSGGQKQRISIARALLIRPRILILDDSTSAVDLATESRIQAALKEGKEERTTILIAQRISSVLEADRILVMDEGRIVAEGNHAQLMDTSSVYQEIYRSQLGKEEISYG